ncbi:MAG: hypothetical protein H7Z40_17260 [Phycisphaerae bacterium]|nr:hypothetical protein [Gemmatimonadaceae bacterium]
MRPRNTVSILLCGTLATSASLSAQQAVPVRDLSQPEARTSQHFGNIFGVRHLRNGGVMVNDGVRRQLVTLDAGFSTRTVVVDSVTEGGQSYGPRASPLIPYLADSSLFVDGQSLSLLVIDPSGKVAHVMSAPKPGDLRFLAASAAGVDALGNLLYRAPTMVIRNTSAGPVASGPPQPPDSSAIVRANFETRLVDTVGRVKIQNGMRANMTQGADGKMNMVMTINPLSTVDEWAVLSDGSIAFVRGHDYHIDWVKPDGQTFSSPKLPFDWKRLTDEDKMALIDSARAAQEKQAADAKAAAANPGAPRVAGADGGGARMEMTVIMAAGSSMGGGGGASIGGGGGGGAPMSFSTGPGGPPGATQISQKIEFVPIKEIPDYYPAIRQGATKADLDGNLWILTTTSAQSKAGELIYDVVNNKGELFQRVRMPAGRSIAGFGHKGIVYLMYRDGTNGWLLERTKVLNSGRAAEN